MSVLRYDQASPLSKPVRLPNGFVRAEGYLTRSGIFVYRDAQGKAIRELRPPEEVMHPDSLASFGLMPVTVVAKPNWPRPADNDSATAA